MTISRVELKNEAKASLKNNWSKAILAVLILFAILIPFNVVSQVASQSGSIGLTWLMLAVLYLIMGPISLGECGYFLDFSEGKAKSPVEVLYGFKNYGKATATYLWMVLFVMLWSFLFIIPGYIAAIAYSQAFFILKENPQIGGRAAIKKSKEMMVGYKMDFFVLCLSFIGWSLLAVLTLGIGFLWLAPYMTTTFANFYKKVKANAETTASTATEAVEEKPANAGPEIK